MDTSRSMVCGNVGADDYEEGHGVCQSMGRLGDVT